MASWTECDERLANQYDCDYVDSNGYINSKLMS